uniref:Glucosylceramidase n=1 Tax=Timema cristinae TaxID=61476 RepID=A0A7R9C9Q0_TIMCR|nr:unnamed protein product [Timema cristinae]
MVAPPMWGPRCKFKPFFNVLWSVNTPPGVVQLQPCVPRDYGANSVVCVCNATYCDFLEPYSNESISNGNYLHYTSSMAGLRLQRDAKTFVKNASIEVDATFQVNRATKYQEIIGFGGAMTDSTAINIHSMSEAAGKNILSVSTRVCALHSAIIVFVRSQQIPYLKQIQKISSQDIKLFTAPWSAPYWMKDNGTAFGRSALRLENYKPWAQYFVKYFDAYADANITFWGLTPQNEPNQGGVHKVHIISMGWTAKQLRGFIAEHLGPTLEENGYSYLKLMAYDDSGLYLPEYLQSILKNETTRSYVSGVAIHAYHDDNIDPNIISNLQTEFPDMFFLYTEGEYLHQITVDDLGTWERGEYYGRSLFQSLNHWVTGWTDWNMVLNTTGGPVWSKAPYNAPIIANASADEFLKQPAFYFMTHFSAFVPPASRRIKLEMTKDGGLETVAFLTPEDNIVINLENRKNKAVSVVINDPDKGDIEFEVQARSIHTLSTALGTPPTASLVRVQHEPLPTAT